ncbi:unnamed protein product [Ophioblennius macclurei]
MESQAATELSLDLASADFLKALEQIDLDEQWPFGNTATKDSNSSFEMIADTFTGDSESWEDMSPSIADLSPTHSSELPEDIWNLISGSDHTPNNDFPAKKKAKVIFSTYQQETLSSVFKRQKYLNRIEVQRVAADLGLTCKQVRTWFQNRRMKLKRKEAKSALEAQILACQAKPAPPIPPIPINTSYNCNFTWKAGQYLVRQTVPSTPTNAAPGPYPVFPYQSQDQQRFSCQSWR